MICISPVLHVKNVFLHKLTKHALDTLLHAFARQVSSHMDFLNKPSRAYNKIVTILHDLLTDPQLQILTDSPFLLHLQKTPTNSAPYSDICYETKIKTFCPQSSLAVSNRSELGQRMSQR